MVKNELMLAYERETGEQSTYAWHGKEFAVDEVFEHAQQRIKELEAQVLEYGRIVFNTPTLRKPKLYLRCRRADRKALSIKGCPNVGIEHLGNCYGEAVTEYGEVVNYHFSSTLDFLRSDLMWGLDAARYEVVDLIDQDAGRLQVE